MLLAPLLAAAAVAGAVTIPFRPPEGAPVAYETEQVRLSAGERQRFRRTDRLSFTRAGEGWRLDLTMTEATATARTDLAALFDYGMRPFQEVTVSVRLTAAGEPVAVLNGPEAWQEISRRLDRLLVELRARNGGESSIVRATQDHFQRYAALDGPARDAQLLQSARELVGFRLPPLAPGASERSPDGALTLMSADAGTARYRTTGGARIEGGEGAQETVTDFAMDRATGLLLSSRTETKVGGTVVASEDVRRIR